MNEPTLHKLADAVRSGGTLPDEVVMEYLPEWALRAWTEKQCACGAAAADHPVARSGNWLGCARAYESTESYTRRDTAGPFCRALAAERILRLNAEARLAAVRAWATEDRPSIPNCLDPAHDDQGCSTCDDLLDGVGHAQVTVLCILAGKEATDA